MHQYLLGKALSLQAGVAGERRREDSGKASDVPPNPATAALLLLAGAGIALRRRVLGSVQGKLVTPDKNLAFGLFAEGNQIDVLVRLRVSANPTTVYVSVTTEVHIWFYIDFSGALAEIEGAPWSKAKVGLLTADHHKRHKGHGASAAG